MQSGARAAASASNVTVNFRTTSSTATGNADYTVKPLTSLTILAGQTSRTITVGVIGDTVREQDESFFLDLSGASHATIADSRGRATIRNDD